MKITKTHILRFSLIAVLFFAVTMPCREFFRVFSVTEVRPAAAFPPVFGLLFGYTGALGCAVGNLAADLLSGYTLPLCAVGFVAQLFYGVFPYWLWRFVSRRFENRSIHFGELANVRIYIAIALINSLAMTAILGGVMQGFGLADFFSMATLMIFFNNFVFSIILGFPIIIFIGKRAANKTDAERHNNDMALSEKLILVFLLLGAMSGALVGFFAYFEISSNTSDPLLLWNKIYIYVSCFMTIFLITAILFLNNYVGKLTGVIIEKERIETELSVATEIQSSMLPRIFPPFPNRGDVDIYGIMQPAKEVGGDFYDFYFVDDDTLAVVIADVSGKGVPAALFMVIAKTMLANYASTKDSLKDIFENVNNALCLNNDAGMFVTCFMGLLNVKTGDFATVNAGHNPPLILSDGEVRYYKSKRGFVLAGREGTKYTESTLRLNPNDIIFLYTDGTTEAADRNNTLYGEQRLLNTVNKFKDLPLKNLCLSVKADIESFVGGCEQADDITMLTIKYIGGSPDTTTGAGDGAL